jgi:hypothetical protein
MVDMVLVRQWASGSLPRSRAHSEPPQRIVVLQPPSSEVLKMSLQLLKYVFFLMEAELEMLFRCDIRAMERNQQAYP